ncbi:replication initiator protein [Dipodfec virus UOA04_Rod_1087]|nr:replication initiator protein [Dipodfec virus UOA04_Rod_1087]
MCISPLRLKQSVEEVDAFGRVRKVNKFVDVPCGKCISCLSNRKRDWVFRLKQEFRHCSSASFITLTYSDENLPYNEKGVPVLVPKDMQDFLKRFRAFVGQPKVRFFGVGEYGSKTLRPHYHLLLFNFPECDLHYVLEKTWKFGMHYIGDVTDGSIEYVCKYCLAGAVLPELIQDFKDFDVPLPFMRCSRRPAIGRCYLTPDAVHYHQEARTLFTAVDGVSTPLPRYYRDKVFTDETLEQLNDDIASVQSKKFNEKFNKWQRKYGTSEAYRLMKDEVEDTLRKVHDKFKLNRNL